MYYAYACKSKNSPITNEPHKYDTLVKARAFGARWTLDGNTVVKIYSRDPFTAPGSFLGKNWEYEEDNGFVGYVSYNKTMNWHYWNIKDYTRPNQKVSEVYFRSRPLYRNGKLAGRF